jgi:hypothetical protein
MEHIREDAEKLFLDIRQHGAPINLKAANRFLDIVERRNIPWESVLVLLILGQHNCRSRDREDANGMGSEITSAIHDMTLAASKLVIINKASEENYPLGMPRLSEDEISMLNNVIKLGDHLAKRIPKRPPPNDSDWLGELCIWWKQLGKTVPKKCHKYSPIHEVALAYGKAFKQIPVSVKDITTRINTFTKQRI